ncbi:tyrosine-type recombinase/integrase [Methylobacterium sp. E-046]|uniref:tyrosine-type recombinase/integrase n=1 Tax=Methylobacterium sp. E-046 TaxID=2836576 RepID=UPI001FBB37FB|nr:tyrosine-type recombinase/integrase [Methylobacterium sp. E-046]MCJ2099206.1 site-specific integrase [Methylobacterium sp. E-046]
MKGHIRERSPGKWAIILDLRDPETGKRKRKWHSFSGTKRGAQKECARLITAIGGGDYVEPNKIMVGDLLLRWLAHARTQVSPRTHERYTEIVLKNLVPAIGGLLLINLKPVQISTIYAKALESGRRDGKGGLAPTTVVYMHRLLKQALAQAVRWELMNRNPADAIDPPKVERKALETYDVDQTIALLDGLEKSRLLIPVMLGVLCGLRRGEIVALRWRHVDLDRGRLTIAESAEQTKAGVRYKPPKSGKGRVVTLPAMLAARLRVHRVGQAEGLLALGVRQTEATFVYTREDGEPIQPRTLTQAWRKIAASGDLPRIRLHDLRHAHATHLLGRGVHPKVASERLGHSRVGITLDLYSHVLPGMQEEAVARVDEALSQALEKRPRSVG